MSLWSDNTGVTQVFHGSAIQNINFVQKGALVVVSRAELCAEVRGAVFSGLGSAMGLSVEVRLEYLLSGVRCYLSFGPVRPGSSQVGAPKRQP